MKIFLGVLEHDVIGEDVGLSDVDPRKLAVGEWDEVVFVGELLCWLGKKNGILPLGDVHDIVEEVEREPENIVEVAHNPEPANADNTTLSFLPSANPESDTTMQSHTHTYTHPRTHSPPLSDLDIFNTTIRDYQTSPVPSSSRHRLESEWTSDEGEPEPQEPEEYEAFEELSFNPVGHSTFQEPIESENEYDDRTSTTSRMNRDYPPPDTAHRTPKTRIPIRYDGYLNEVDEEEEIRSFEASRDYTQRMADLTISSPSPFSRSSRQDKVESARYPSGLSRTSTPRRPSSSNTTPTGHSSVPRIVTRHNSPSQHALALMSERARLKEELAQIKARRS
ncbi:unnamed protein product [Somion occarium]|uniref:Uncharacterized protein n=1 Tax=Somion occarium TaxID=3059160 RepID=A0ABP1DY12_9APHY